MTYLTEDFLLYSKPARRLYHDYAREMPIFDYHCHLPVKDIADNKQFENLTRIWLYGDHYKWRAMRAYGLDERFITGNASDYKKYESWSSVVPYTIQNPLYHWTHMELKNPFGITDKLLNLNSAREIYDTCTKLLKTEEFRAQAIMQRNKVRVVCTTDDPADNLEHHLRIREEKDNNIKVLPVFRPDKVLAVEDSVSFNNWLTRLEETADIHIKNLSTFLLALHRRHDFFHQVGCRLSDRSIEYPYASEYTEKEIASIFIKLRRGKQLVPFEIAKFKSALLFEMAVMDDKKKWTQQFHFGALKNSNIRQFKRLGPDTGFDSIGDFEIAQPLVKFLNRLDNKNKLAKTIIYVANPQDNYMIASIIGSFQDSSVPGKIQFGPAWWFNDQKDGIEQQINALSRIGLLSCFVGMTTDSRSFLSYSRHEYFRRILCNLIGKAIEDGELPHDLNMLGKIVQDICYNNALNYFSVE